MEIIHVPVTKSVAKSTMHNSSTSSISTSSASTLLHSRSSAGPHTVVNREAPSRAATLFMLVCMKGDAVCSVHNSSFIYPPNATLLQGISSEEEGAVWGYASVLEAINLEPQAVLKQHRCTDLTIGVFKAWNTDPMELPEKHGSKQHFTYVALAGTMPISATLQEALAARVEPRARRILPEALVSKAPAKPPRDVLASGRSAWSVPLRSQDSDRKACKDTDSLAEDVRAMQRQLMELGDLGRKSQTVTPQLAPVAEPRAKFKS